MKLAAALCAVLLAPAAPAQEPQPGVEHDSWRQVRLSAVGGADCLEFVSSNHTIRLALADLRAMALDAARIMGGATEPRVLRIFEGRTQDLLGRAAGWPAGGGCVQASAAAGEDRHVIAELLRAGRAEVRKPGSELGVGAIWMRHLGRRAGPLAGRGEILFYAEREGEPFFVVSWWAS